jgi:hypothetical protein
MLISIRSVGGTPLIGVGRNTNTTDTFSYSLVWDGTFNGGAAAPNGQYRLALRALKMFASNVDDANSWDTFITPVFTVAR